MEIDKRALFSFWVPLLLLAVAYFLRIYHLDAQSIWGDEAMSIVISALPLDQTLTAEANPPAYFWVLKLTRSFWGSSEFGLRYLSVLCGVLTVAMIGATGKQCLAASANQRGGMQLRNWSLLVASFSPFLVYYAQEARMYAVVQIGVTGSLWLFLIILQRQWRRVSAEIVVWIGYAACSLLAVFSHYYSFTVLLGQALVACFVLGLARRWRSLSHWLLVWTGMALLFIPYFLIHRRAWGGQISLRSEEWAFRPMLTIAQRTITAFSVGTTFSAETTFYALAIFGLAILGTITLLRTARLAGATLLTIVLCGLLYAWAITPLLPFFWERYLLPILPAYLLLIAAGLAYLARRQKFLAVPITLIFLAINLYSINGYFRDSNYIKGGYREAMAEIATRAQPGDLILLNGPLQAALFSYYQPSHVDSQLIARDQLLDPLSAETYLADSTAGYTRIWLVESGNPQEYDPNGVARQSLSKFGRFALHRDYVGVGLDLFVMGSSQEATTPTAYDFGGEIMLTGFTVESAEINTTDPILLTLFWQAQHQLSNSYTVFTHLINAQGELIAQTDRQPAGGSRPTTSWQPGQTISDSYAILLPSNTPPGTYTLQVGLYLWPELTRLSLPDGSDKVTLTQITIER